MIRFVATHLICHDKRRIPVRIVDGACYTRTEWMAGICADWEFSEDDGLTFQGQWLPNASIEGLRIAELKQIDNPNADAASARSV